MSMYTAVASTRSEGTSPEQRAVVQVIRDLRRQRPHYGPTIREIASELGVTINDVYGKLTRLRRDGVVTWEPGIPRTIRIVGE